MTASLPPDPADVLARLEELHKAATPGPWIVWQQAPDVTAVGAGCRFVWGFPSNPTLWVTSDADPADAAAIVAEHNAMPALLAAVRDALAEHRRVAESPTDPNGDYCGTDGDTWPCPTVTAITAALEGAR